MIRHPIWHDMIRCHHLILYNIIYIPICEALMAVRTMVKHVLSALEVRGTLLVELGLIRLAHRIQNDSRTSKSCKSQWIESVRDKQGHRDEGEDGEGFQLTGSIWLFRGISE